MPYGWRQLQSGGDPVLIWANPSRNEFIRVLTDSDSLTCHVEVSLPIPTADTAGEGFVGYRRISPYFISDGKTVGRQAYMRQHYAKNTGDWEPGGIPECLSIVESYMRKHSGA